VFPGGASRATLERLEVRLVIPRRALVWVGTLGAVAVVAVAWGMVVRTLRDGHAIVPTTRPNSVVWGDRVFGSRNELAGWLRSRGGSYVVWRAAHPRASVVLEPAAPRATARGKDSPRQAAAVHKRATTRRTATAGAERNAAGRRAATPVVSTAVQSSGPLRFLILLSILLSGLCALGASVPWALASRNPRLVQVVEPYRQLLFGTAAALLMGLVVGVALS
jgi:hypothetical protein